MDKAKQIFLQYITNFGGLDKSFRDEFKEEAGIQAWLRAIVVSVEFTILSVMGLILTHVKHRHDISAPMVARMASLTVLLIVSLGFIGAAAYLSKKRPKDKKIRRKITLIFWGLFYCSSIALTYSGVMAFNDKNDLDFAVLVMLCMSVIGLFAMFNFWLNFAVLGTYVCIVAHFILFSNGNRFFYPYLTFCLIICCVMSAVQYSYTQRLFMERKALERVNLRLSALAHEAVNKANSATLVKSDFISRISHDMRTPMNGIMGLIHLTLRENLSQQVRDNVVRMDQTGKYLLSIINDTLDMRRIEEGDFKLKYEAVGLKEFINGISVALEPSIKEKKQHFNIKQINVSDCFAKLDRVRTQQIFMNILSNAVKFTPTGGNISCEIEEYSNDGNTIGLRFTISDDGIGISEEFMPHVFEQFAQEEPDNSDYAGSGIGLAIVKLLVDTMKGRVEVESRKNFGTTVNVYLETEIIKTPEDYMFVEDESAAVIKDRHILICEDNPLNAEIAKKLLEAKGATVDCAANGAIGVEKFDKSPKGYYSLVFMDIGMPVMNGYEATRNIRNLRRNDAILVPIIALTANSTQKEVDESLKAGMDDHIIKPFDVNDLYDTVSKAILLYEDRMNHKPEDDEIPV